MVKLVDKWPVKKGERFADPYFKPTSIHFDHFKLLEEARKFSEELLRECSKFLPEESFWVELTAELDIEKGLIHEGPYVIELKLDDRVFTKETLKKESPSEIVARELKPFLKKWKVKVLTFEEHLRMYRILMKELGKLRGSG